MSEELELCPFCGRDDDANNAVQEAAVAVRSIRTPLGVDGYEAACICGAKGPRALQRSDAIAAWNRRAPSPDMREVVEALERLSENIASFDAEVAFELSNEGERADLWTDIDVNVEDLRIVVAALRSLTGAKP